MSAPKPFPTLRGLPLLGHLAQFRRNLLVVLERSLATCGDLARVPVAYESIHVLSGPEAIERVLIDNYRNYSRGQSHGALWRLIGDGMLTTEHEAWVPYRRAAKSDFRTARVDALVDTIESLIEVRMARWTALAASGEPVSLANEMMALTAQVTTAAFFDYPLGEARADAFVRAFLVAQIHAFSRLTNPLQLPSLRPRAAMRWLDALGNDLTRHAPRSPLVPQVMTLVATAPENPSNTLAWILFELARNPEIEARVRAEAELPPADREYTDLVIAESLRLYPGAWGFERRAEEADVLAGHALPARALVLVSPYTLHRNRRLWPEPLRFDPERFRDGADGDRHRLAYMPFSTGPRRCIGDHFTRVVVRTVLPRFLARFRVHVSPAERGEMLPLFTLRPRTGIVARLEKRPLQARRPSALHAAASA